MKYKCILPYSSPKILIPTSPKVTTRKNFLCILPGMSLVFMCAYIYIICVI